MIKFGMNENGFRNVTSKLRLVKIRVSRHMSLVLLVGLTGQLNKDIIE